MKQATINNLVADSLAIEQEAARDAGTLGYLARAMVQATMPHRRTEQLHHTRVNGDYRLNMAALDPLVGLPYGSVPRLLLAWIGAEAIRTKSQQLVLGFSMSQFMGELGMIPTGGRWGTVTRLKDQSTRLFGCVISCSYTNADRLITGKPFNIGEADMWWRPQQPEQLGLFQSTLTLSDAFYDEILSHPVPVDMRVLKMLRRSPMALDVYAWTTYRMYTLNRSRRDRVSIPWGSLQLQFGADYSFDGQGPRDFRRAFLRELNKVQALAYPDARIEHDKAGLTLKRSPLHLPTLPLKKAHATD